MPTYVETVIKIWTRWQIQALTLLSLLLQVILTAFGSKRKVRASKWINILVWSTYLSADWVATVALGILARSYGEESGKNNAPNQNYSLQAFWAPFFLLHLGGPDAITAYSLEDNELWLRHLLGLVFQVAVAIYVFFRSWVDGQTTLSFIAIPVFIAGIIKYGERTWALRSSSTKQFKTSLLLPDPPEEPPVMNNCDASWVFRHQAAFFLFKRLKVLFSGFILHHQEGEHCKRIIFSLKNSLDAFKLVEFELGILYDVLYTKGTIVYSFVGIILRCITFLASVSALVTFSSIISYERSYSLVDITVTYFLLVGAVVLEVYALVNFASSDWTMLFLVRQRKKYCPKKMTNGKRWSRAIYQYNLINFCLAKERTRWMVVQKLLGIHDILEKQEVDKELQEFIFSHLKKKLMKSPDYLENIESCKKLLKYRGDCVLEEMNCHTDLKWSTTDVEFNHSIFIWHIATELCYYDDIRSFGHGSDEVKKCTKISRSLSSYMLYLLFVCPDMLPKGIDQIRCNEAKRTLKSKGFEDIREACTYFDKIRQSELGDPLHFDGSRLFDQLQKMKPQNQDNWGYKKKWEMMNEVWMELLTYAASHCGWKEHGNQLSKGGELLTHVCVLMAHFGLSEQYLDLPQKQLPLSRLRLIPRPRL